MPLRGDAETIEQRALDAWYEVVATGWERHTIGDATCYVSATDPSILVNRVLGLGSDRPITVDQLIEIRELYGNAGVSRFFLHVLPDVLGEGHATMLSDAGYEKYRGWMKFERGAGEIRPVTTDLSIRQIGTEHADAFAAIVGPAFDFEPAFQPAIAALLDAPGWRAFMSFDGDTPAGTGALFMHEGVGYLDFGATHPDFRRRGAQSGVLSTRIQAALDAGCHKLVTMTGEAVPGDEQHSYRNIEKAGFSASYLRENWIPAGS